ncbi:unnamed protein product [Chrysoparadoxa australica]
MTYPHNLQMAERVSRIVRDSGVVPATVAMMDGVPHVGLAPSQIETLAKGGAEVVKCSRRDLAMVKSKKLHGATTVAATMFLAAQAGIKVFVTGGIGGVHRGGENTLDWSADLTELGRTPIAVICAGVKSILDIGRTLEVLETQGVPVISYGADEVPAFFSPSSGVKSPLRLDTPSEVASLICASSDLGLEGGVVVAVPCPKTEAGDVIEQAIQEALQEAQIQGISGKEVTPFLLKHVNEITGGGSLEANITLVEENARVGAAIAWHLSQGSVSSDDNAVSLQDPAGASTASRTEVTVVGGAVVDRTAKSYDMLKFGTSNPGTLTESFGGVGRNIAEALSLLGTKTSLVSVVGEDSAGKLLVDHLRSQGVETSGVTTGGEGSRTGNYLAVLGDTNDLHLGIADMEVMSHICHEAIEKGLRGDRVVISDGNLTQAAFQHLTHLCKERSLLHIFEPTSVAKCTLPISSGSLGGVNIVSPNLDELVAMCQALGLHRHPYDDIIQEVKNGGTDRDAVKPLMNGLKPMFDVLLREMGEPPQQTKAVVLTLGCQGAVLATPSSCDHYAAIHIPQHSLKSSTGAGDTLVAGLAHALACEHDVSTSVKHGMACAAEALGSCSAVSPTLARKSLIKSPM